MKPTESKGGELAALVAAAHELKSPLVLVQHLARTLADESVVLTEAERAQYLHRLQFTSDRMLRLVQQLALSYRLDADRQLAFQFQLEPIQVGEMFDAVAHELSPYIRAANQRLLVRPARQLVVANRDILHDIMVNLVDNAVRHNPAGAEVALSAQTQGDAVRLRVSDQGADILPHELARLRRTVGTQPQPLSGRSGTSGLGLYIAGQFAQSMGGTLGLGHAATGTHFFVDLMRSRQLSLL